MAQKFVPQLAEVIVVVSAAAAAVADVADVAGRPLYEIPGRYIAL